MIVDNDGMCTLDDEDKSYHSNMIRKRTNADKIRQMSDKELARWLAGYVLNFPDGWQLNDATAAWLEWLKQEVESDG